MLIMKKSLFLIIALSVIVALQSCKSNTTKQKPKYVFYMIGDGFGVAQSQLAEEYLDAMAKDSAKCNLDIMNLPVLGMAATYSANSFITCSSAAGTALSTGFKTKNNMLGILPDSTTNVTSIAKKFHDDGYNVGIVATVTLDHATPAAFYAHVINRNMYKEISYQLKDVEYEYFGGAGLRGYKYDKGIYDTLRNHGFKVSSNIDEINGHKLSDGKLFAFNKAAENRPNDIPYCIDSKDDKMHLPFFVKKGIDLFENDDKGFFMMIEGSQIDYACHDNDPAAELWEVIDFNEAYKLVYDFYQRHPDETLIVITADHETGGLTIGQSSQGYACYPELLQYQTMSGEKFNKKINQMVEAGEKPKLDEIYAMLKTDFGFNNDNPKMQLNEDDSVRIEYFYNKTFNDKKVSLKMEILKNKMFNTDTRDIVNLGDVCKRIMSEKAGIGWTTSAHTGSGVPVRALGVGQEKFGGYYNNTDLPNKIYGMK